MIKKQAVFEQSLTANFSLLLTRLPVKADQLKTGSNNEVAFHFTVKSNVAITTQNFVNKVGTMFFGTAELRL